MKSFLIKSTYSVEELISEDIISFCYQGKTTYGDVPIVVWQYKTEYLSASLVKQLIDVCERLMQVQHKHVLKLIDYYYDGESFYTIHESSDSFVTLDTFVKQLDTFDLKLLWKFSTHILNFLLYLEQQHLYAGGVNFSTIIVTQSNEIYFTRIMLPILIYKHNWKTLDVLEDCIFLAPEFIGSNDYSIRSDMYSFGVLLYVFFSQSWPYKYSIKIDSMKKALIEGPHEFEPSHPKIPDRLKRIIDVCLRPDPASRLRSFGELIKVYKDNLKITDLAADSQSEVINHLKQYVSQKMHVSMMRFLKGISALFFVVIISGLVYLGYSYYITAIPEVAVPQLVGMEAALAEERLSQYKLKSMIAGERFHPVVEKGLIIDTKPPSGRVVKENRVVRLFVSKGKGPILVPDLIGYTKQNVEDKLYGKGLITEVESERFSLQYPVGTVIAQTPIANTFIGPSENIRLVLSKGYPVDISIKKAKSSFFQNKDHLRTVKVQFFIIDDWPDQEIAIYYTFESRKDQLYKDLVKSGDSLQLEFELEKQGFFDIYFNDQLTIRKKIDYEDL